MGEIKKRIVYTTIKTGGLIILTLLLVNPMKPTIATKIDPVQKAYEGIELVKREIQQATDWAVEVAFLLSGSAMFFILITYFFKKVDD